MSNNMDDDNYLPRVIELAREGLPAGKIAVSLGISTSRVGVILRRNGRHPPRWIFIERLREIEPELLQQFEDGKTYAEIAEHYGTTTNTIRDILKFNAGSVMAARRAERRRLARVKIVGVLNKCAQCKQPFRAIPSQRYCSEPCFICAAPALIESGANMTTLSVFAARNIPTTKALLIKEGIIGKVTEEMIGYSEISIISGRGLAAIYRWRSEMDFPTKINTLTKTIVFDRGEVMEWLRDRGKISKISNRPPNGDYAVNDTIRVKVGSEPYMTTDNRFARYSNFLAYRGGRSVYVEQKLDSLIESLSAIRDEYQDQYSDLEISPERDCGCYRDCDCSPSYYVYGKREREPIEIEYEQKKTAEREAEQKACDEAEYERLRAKFEK